MSCMVVSCHDYILIKTQRRVNWKITFVYHPNTHRKKFLQPVTDLIFWSLIFTTFSSQFHDFIHFLLVGIHISPHCNPWMFTIFLLKPMDILKESLSKTSSSYSRLLQTSYFIGILFLQLTTSNIQHVFS